MLSALQWPAVPAVLQTPHARSMERLGGVSSQGLHGLSEGGSSSLMLVAARSRVGVASTHPSGEADPSERMLLVAARLRREEEEEVACPVASEHRSYNLVVPARTNEGLGESNVPSGWSRGCHSSGTRASSTPRKLYKPTQVLLPSQSVTTWYRRSLQN